LAALHRRQMARRWAASPSLVTIVECSLMAIASRPLPVIPAARPHPVPSTVGMPIRNPDADRIGGLNLTAVPLLRFLLTNRWVQPVVQVLSISFFAYLLFDGFFGVQDNKASFAYAAFWTVWWNPVMTISLLLVGRAWCYVCPIGAVTNALQRFSLGYRFPTYLKPKVRVLGIGLSVLSISALTFLVMRAALFGGGLRAFPWMTSVFFLGMLLLAVSLTLVYRQRPFCRYICPATGVMTVTAKLAPFQLAQTSDRGVINCMTAEFQSNYLSNERRCVACMHCTTSRPDATVKLQAAWPGARAVQERIPLPDEALIALVIFAVFPINHVIVPWLFRDVPALKAITDGLAPVAAGYLRYTLAIVGGIVAFGLVNAVAARLAGLGWETSFTRFANAYIPLGILFTFGMHTIPALMTSGGTMANVLGAAVGLQLNLPAAWAGPATIAAWNAFSMNGLHWVSALWGGIIAWMIARDLTRDRQHGLRSAVLAVMPHLLLTVAVSWLVVTVMPPMQH
jgi:polyferredoxin